VVLITDRNYLTPTLAAALSADRHTAGAPVGIELFVLDAAEEWVDEVGAAAAGTKIVLRTAQLPGFSDLARHHRDRYLPPIALARLWLDDLLDPGVDRFLYLDGDTMVDASLVDLLAAAPPQHGVAAVNDALATYAAERSRSRDADFTYLEGIGVSADQYFNSGVLYCNRTAWSEIAKTAREFLESYPERCRSSDQSALNNASRGRVSLLPLRYNYQSEHMIVFDPRRGPRRPAIWHFTGAPKPWDGADWPWDPSFNAFFREAEERLAPFCAGPPQPPAAQLAAGLAHRRRARFRLTWVYPWRRLSRRRWIAAHL
jgi:lipopolysaccharide biosynthesis glycosyltransferase